MITRFCELAKWERVARDRGLLFAPISHRGLSTKDFDICFTVDQGSYTDYGVFNASLGFGVICDTPAEFTTWRGGK